MVEGLRAGAAVEREVKAQRSAIVTANKTAVEAVALSQGTFSSKNTH